MRTLILALLGFASRDLPPLPCGSKGCPLCPGTHRRRKKPRVSLAHENLKYYDGYLRGDYSSVTAAATAVGILTDDGNTKPLGFFLD